MRTFLAVVSCAALLAACSDNASGPPAAPAAEGRPGPDPALPTVIAPASPAEGDQGGTADWRQVVSPLHSANLGRLDEAWRLGRAEAEDNGFAENVESLGPLVDPNAGQAGRLQPPPGSYQCRTIKLGTNSPGGPGYLEYPFFRCTIELTPGGDLLLTKITGSQRTKGLLYPDTDRRLIYVGAAAWSAEETTYPAYGDDPLRDQVGVFERIGAARWRLAIPWPKVDSKLEILELVR